MNRANARIRVLLTYLTSIAIAAGFVIGLAGPAFASGTRVPNPIPFGDDVQVRDKVRSEYDLGKKTAQFIAQYRDDIAVVSGNLGNSGRVLDVKITQVFAAGGGAFSGPKWMELTGTLKQVGKHVASFRAKRFSTGGAFGALKGTCAIIGRCTKTLGKDVAMWLKDPKDGAKLGDAR